MSVRRALRDRGYRAEDARDVLAAGTSDVVLAALAERQGWVIVTMDRHFDALVKRVPDSGKTRFRRAGRITLHCNEAHAARRVEVAMPHIELEWELLKDATDQRMLLVIRDSNLTIDR
jgi:predicted nuclease of predicted toxin-antitoxin system